MFEGGFVAGAFAVVTAVTARLSVYLAASWEERWVESQEKSDYGKFVWTAGKFYGDAEKDKGAS